MTTPCAGDNFADSSTLAFGQDRVTMHGPFRQLATTDGVDNTARILIDQTVDWTWIGLHPVRAHVLFHRPPRSVRAQGPRQHYIDEKWAITSNGAAPVLPGTLSTRFAGGVDRNAANWYWNHWEASMTYMPSGLGQVVRTTGQQIRIRYQASLAVSAAGGSNMNVTSYWHEIYIVTTPLPLT